MKFRTSLTALLVLAVSATAFADAKDDLAAAVNKTADSANYSWTSTVEGGFGGGKTTGKTEKDGYTTFQIAGRNQTSDVVMKGKKAVVKTDSGWKTPEEMTADTSADANGGGGRRFNPARMIATQVENFKAPLQQAKDNLDKLQDVKAEADGFTGKLSDEAAKSAMAFGRRGGAAATGGGPEFKDLKVTYHIWTKDGQVSKVEQHVTGSVSFNGNDRDIDRTTTTEITDVGTTKIEVPEDAKKKLEG